MTTDELLTFIEDEFSKGTKAEEVHRKLKELIATHLRIQLRTVVKERVSKGWTEEQILRALLKGGQLSELDAKTISQIVSSCIRGADDKNVP